MLGLQLTNLYIKYMKRTSRQSLSRISVNPNIVINDNPVKQVLVSKSLGVKIDQRLNCMGESY